MSAREVMKDVLLQAGCQAACCGNDDACECAAVSDAILAALREAGLVVMPVEPTRAMDDAGVNAMASLEYIAANEHEARHIYRAMLAAQEDQR